MRRGREKMGKCKKKKEREKKKNNGGIEKEKIRSKGA
jgi:hypothetical protein